MSLFAGFLLVNLMVLLAVAGGALLWFTAAGQPSFYLAFLVVNAIIAWTYLNRRRRNSDPACDYAEGSDWVAGGFDGGCD